MFPLCKRDISSSCDYVLSGEMFNMARVAVVIVNYNAGKALREAVATSLLSRAVDKVMVVDNGSVDSSMSDLQNFAADESRLVCIYNRKNLGFAKACNMAIRETDADYLLFLNPDCVLHPGAVEEMLKSVMADGRAAVVGPVLINPDGSEQAGGRRAVPTPWRSFVRAFGMARLSKRYLRLFSDYHLSKEPLPDVPVEVEAISGSCMLVRRTALDKVGLLDEKYFLHCEDLDWCMRFRMQGWKILFVPSARVVHLKGECSKIRPVFVEWNKHKGMVRFYRKFFRHQYPGLLMWLVWCGVWLRFGAVAAYYSGKRISQWLKG